MRRVAISNSRILTVEDDHITFRYRASDSGQAKFCTVAAEEFIHRFLQHVLPKGFVKVRYYGFLSVALRTQLTTLRQHLAPSVTASDFASAPETADQPTRGAESFATTRIPLAAEIPNVAPLAPLPLADHTVSSSISSSAETSEPPAATISPPSSSSTSPREVPRGGCALRCPSCGRLLLRGSVLFPAQGHPP